MSVSNQNARTPIIRLAVMGLGLALAGCGPTAQPADTAPLPEQAATDTGPLPPFDPTAPFERNYAALARVAYDLTPSAFSDTSPGSNSDITYRPSCSSSACQVWSRYRLQRPFPLQTLAFAKSGANGVLIITEPNLSRAKLDGALHEIFGANISTEAQRWMIGFDGWLGDMVVTLPAEVSPKTTDPLADEVFRDRLSMLAEDLWGTSFGLYVEDAVSPWKDVALAAAPRLDVNPAELESWLLDSDLSWRDPAGGQSRSFADLANEGGVGTYVSSSGELALFVIDGASVQAGGLRGRHADFRRFAILADAVIGGVWNDSNGYLALVGRARQAPPTVVPPLRFETLQLLAAQQFDMLSQSYERTLPMAGKLLSGLYEGKDWAPIYLSYDLIDSEYGALLNITDQMLKSWSSAGEIQYVFFDYPLRPMPGRFAFNDRSIMSILTEKTGGTSVLFNWNTAGAAAIVSENGWSALSPTQSSSLPITYGSELTPGSGMQMGDLTKEYEDQAYAFFSGLGDPNLARVVSYATIFQSLRANPMATRSDADSTEPRTAAGKQVRARAQAGTNFLVGKVAETLASFERGEIPQGATARMSDLQLRELKEEYSKEEQQSEEFKRFLAAQAQANQQDIADALADMVAGARMQITSFKAKHAQYSDNKVLANLLVDRGSMPKLMAELNRTNDALNREIETYNNAYFSTQSQADAAGARIDAKRVKLDRDFDALMAVGDDIEKLQSVLSETFSLTGDTDGVRAQFVKAHSGPNVGWIRTPSIVLSWSEANEFAVGGHNLDARALRIEVSPTLKAPEIVELPTGPVLRVPQSAAQSARANANEIARMIEHGRIDQASLTSRLTSLPASGPVRAPSQALGLTGSRITLLPVRGGALSSTRAGIADVHATLRAQTGDHSLLAIRLENGRISMSFSKNGKIDCCTEADGFSQFNKYAKNQAEAGGNIAVSGFEPGQVRALEISLSGEGRAAVSQALGSGRGGSGGPPTNEVTVLAGGGKRGGGEPPTGGRPPGGDGPTTPQGPQKVIVAGEFKNPIIAAKKPRTVDTVERLNEGEAALAAREASFQLPTDGSAAILRIKLTDVQSPTAKSEALAIVDAAPANLEIAVALAEKAIVQAKSATNNLFDLTQEAKAIVARDKNSSAIRKLWIWAKDAAGAFWLSEIDLGETGIQRG